MRLTTGVSESDWFSGGVSGGSFSSLNVSVLGLFCLTQKGRVRSPN